MSPARFTTEQIIQAVTQHPERWRSVTRESALSLPVPVGSAGSEGLAFFWYPIGGPIQNRIVQVPTHRVQAGLTRLDDITFLPTGASDLGLGVAPGTLLGPPRIGGPMPAGERETQRSELFGLLDLLIDPILSAVPPTDDQQAAAARLNLLFHRLAVVSLLPAYRSLNPEFFAWLRDYGL